LYKEVKDEEEFNTKFKEDHETVAVGQVTTVKITVDNAVKMIAVVIITIMILTY